jgi:hypothetical protein
MPGIEHEAIVQLLHDKPQLAATLLTALGAGARVPAGATAAVADSDLSARRPLALIAENVIKFSGPAGKLVVIAEVQKDPPDRKKLRDWPAYVSVAGVEHGCDVVLVVIALRPQTARASRKLIRTGHPGFDLAPLVIDAGNTPLSGQSDVNAELIVLAFLTGALDVSSHDARMFILCNLAHIHPEQRDRYTRLIRALASDTDRLELEDLMRTVIKDKFMDGLIDQGRAEGRVEGRVEGEAHLLLRILATRGFSVPDAVRYRVTSCTDTAQLEAWADRAVTSAGLDEIFAG